MILVLFPQMAGTHKHPIILRVNVTIRNAATSTPIVPAVDARTASGVLLLGHGDLRKPPAFAQPTMWAHDADMYGTSRLIRCMERDCTRINLSTEHLFDDGAFVVARCLERRGQRCSSNNNHNTIVTTRTNRESSLKVLHLSETGIGPDGGMAIVSVLRSYPYLLEELDLSENPIGPKVATALLGICGEESCTLKRLVLRNCSLSGFLDGDNDEDNRNMNTVGTVRDSLVRSKSLQVLDVSRNAIQDSDIAGIADIIRRNNVLTSLDLSETELDQEGLDVLTGALRTNTILHVLRLADAFGYVEPDFSSLAMALLSPGCGIQRLDLEDTGLQDESMQCLGDALRTNTSLLWLNLGKNNLRAGDVGIRHLAESLTVNTTLKELILSDNAELGRALIPLFRVLEHDNNTLERLDVPFCGIDSDTGRALARAIESNKGLLNLNVTTNTDMGKVAIVEIVHALSVNENLTAICLDHIGMDSDCGLALGLSLRRNTTLQRLDVSRNPSLDDDGLVAVLDGLSSNTSIVSFTLTDNSKLSDSTECMEALARMVSQNQHLRVLDLNDCSINDDGAIILANGLANNKTLEEVHLSWNEFESVGARALLEAIVDSPALRFLDISLIEWTTADLYKRAIEILQMNPKLVIRLWNGEPEFPAILSDLPMMDDEEEIDPAVELLTAVESIRLYAHLNEIRFPDLFRAERRLLWPYLIGNVQTRAFDLDVIYLLLRNAPDVVPART